MEAEPAKQAWEATLGELQIQVSKSNYRTWLEKTVGLSYQDNQFVIGVPNTFVAEYLDKKQRSLIEKTLNGVTGRDLKVLFQVDTTEQISSGGYGVREKAPAKLNSKYTFDSFVTGNCNRLAYAAALAVAEKPGQTYNPLFIYGGPGLGKTHLLHAIGHMALTNHFKALYVSGEQFTNEFIQAIQQRKTEEFRNKYRKVDMLLIDDIHFIIGKEQTEECFFHTFNELHNTNRQIAVTSDRSPKAMPLLEERLCSRFQWGLTVDIQPPDFETRLAILQAKAKQKGQDIASVVLDFIAQRIKQNVRELEGSLNRVIAYAKLLRALVTPEVAAQALENIATKPSQGTAITPTRVIEAVADSFQLASTDLTGRKRDKETALARQIAMYLIQQETSRSLAQIGKELGDRNPATVSHACEKIASEIQASPYLMRKISDIKEHIQPRTKSKKKR
ncbi:MAG: chromosomal replication initiator protein DnaA [Dehalococcoidia bacterium]|nr:MAG: chromosomal replication initiator protein DnaA [Dehalococcoidia bacterium]